MTRPVQADIRTLMRFYELGYRRAAIYRARVYMDKTYAIGWRGSCWRRFHTRVRLLLCRRHGIDDSQVELTAEYAAYGDGWDAGYKDTAEHERLACATLLGSLTDD